MAYKLIKGLESNYINSIGKLLYLDLDLCALKTCAFVRPSVNYTPLLTTLKFQYNYSKLGG